VLLVCLLVWAGYQDVIQVHKHKVQARQNLVHQPLECLDCIPKSKRHPQKLPQPEGSDDRRLADVAVGDLHLVVPLLEVQLGEHPAPVKAGGEVLDVWDRVLVHCSNQVQTAVVATRPPRAVRLAHHMQRGRPAALGPPYNALPLHGQELRFRRL